MNGYKIAEQLINEICEPEDVVAVEAYVEDFALWVINAIQGKVASRRKAVINEHTNYNASKLELSEARTQIRKLTLESAKARNAREQAEIEAKFKANVSKKG